MKTFSAHFDGEVVVLDEPATIPPNTPVQVLVPELPAERDEGRNEFARMSEPTFDRIWNNALDAEYDKL